MIALSTLILTTGLKYRSLLPLPVHVNSIKTRLKSLHLVPLEFFGNVMNRDIWNMSRLVNFIWRKQLSQFPHYLVVWKAQLGSDLILVPSYFRMSIPVMSWSVTRDCSRFLWFGSSKRSDISFSRFIQRWSDSLIMFLCEYLDFQNLMCLTLLWRLKSSNFFCFFFVEMIVPYFFRIFYFLFN